MSAPDARTRRKISLQPARVLSVSYVLTLAVQSNALIIPRLGTSAFPRIVLSNILFVLALFAAKESLLSYDVGVFWVVMRVLALGALGMLVWQGLTLEFSKGLQIEWTALGVSSLLLFVQQAALYTALYRLSSLRVILFVHFSSSWVDATISRPLVVASSFVLSFFADITLSHRTPANIFPGYACVILHGLATHALEQLRGVLSPTISPTIATAASTFGAALIGLPLYTFRRAMLDSRPSPVVPLLSLAVLPLLTFNTVFLTPDTKTKQYNSQQAVQVFLLSYPSAFIVAIALGRLGFSQHPHWIDLVLGAMLYYARYTSRDQTPSSSPRTPISKLIRFYLNSILSDNESRKIFYFLALNLCYMLVQMLYGVWTNSLGLISDAIHMAFDCLAIGVGLLASVMAKWPPNERFTYGYGRIETLSGFANGIFLILISIFIVFEAVQRLIDPPEMSTSQLLLISSLGLGVNLFGMFAMGGHHHHGHSHDHGCGHGHGHDHDHNHEHKRSHRSHPHDDHVHHSNNHGTSLPHHDHASHHVHHNSDSHTLDSYDHRKHNSAHRSHSHAIVASSQQDPHSRPHHHHERQESEPSHTHPHVHVHSDESHSDSHHSSPADVGQSQQSPKSSTIRERKPHSRGPSLQITSEISLSFSAPTVQIPFPLSSPVDSPISPNYPSTFKHDHHPVHHHHDVGHGHAVHTHGHDHAHESHSHNMRGVFLHVMADTLGSVGVIVSTLLIQYYGWTGFDPIASLFIAVLIVASVVPLVIDTGRVLSLDLGDNENRVEMALKELEHMEGVASYSSPRFWPKDSSSVIGSIHVQLACSVSRSHSSDVPSNKQSSIDRVLERVDSLLKSRIPGLEEVTIQLEEVSGG
ncbi:cation efflux protein [Lanmaoa asiatica]|nr:cation efflux protein [Lanmaoa asiatica]